MPSSSRQLRTTARELACVSAKRGWTAVARSTKRRAASDRVRVVGDDRASGWSRVSEGARQDAIPGIRSVSRLVARICTPCGVAKSVARSSRPFVGVVQPAQNWPRSDRAGAGAETRYRRLEGERPVRTLQVVVADQRGQDRPEVPLVEDDHVIQTLPAQGADQPFGDRVRTGRTDRGEE